ncbi:type II secretion system protein GspM [Ensifer sp. LC163]|uniref:type II secretion system protein GspM n=1 Tax=Ensifer sp. LC163 TaxID=1120652 RepID=UPI00081373D5|nr:type II secretion system protein GspM [Ensifer sp. LC163]OCP36084.1 hypothetical protein BC360_25395 [Ensifer sp. LC163]
MRTPRGSTRRVRVAAIAALSCLVLLPVLVVAWSAIVVSRLAEENRNDTALVDTLKARLSALGGGVGGVGDGASVRSYLPGDTPAIAGAELQRLVTDIIGQTGAVVSQFEFVASEETDPAGGTVEMRILFHTTIEPLQKILFATETNTTALVVKSINIESLALDEEAPHASPTLRVLALVEGYWRRAER